MRRGISVDYLMPFGPERWSYAAAAAPAARAHTPVPGEAVASGERPLYGPDLLREVEGFAERCLALASARGLDCDLIHAHDWTTFRAGLALRRATGRPLVVHVHITEFDKSGGAHADPRIFALEQEGLREADLVVAVSRRVRDRCIETYGADPARVRVLYNAIDSDPSSPAPLPIDAPLVLFLGRVTLQKGPEYFLEAARRVHEVEPEVVFVLAGQGDMLPRMVERAAELGLGSRVLLPGFVDRERAAATS